MSTASDLRLSFPLVLICMATLSWTLLSALDQSAASSTGRPVGPNSPEVNQESEIKNAPGSVPPVKDPVTAKDHTAADEPVLNHFSDGLDEDIYWNDGSV